MDLKTALRLVDQPRLALVGAGGKTSALFQLARAYEGPVMVTASAHLAVEQIPWADHHILSDALEARLPFEDQPPGGVTLVTGPIEADRTTGLAEGDLFWLDRYCRRHAIPMLIEADGSRQLPLKAPAAHEPPIPPFADTVVVVVGLSGLGKTLSAEWVHRPRLFSALSGLSLGEQLPFEAVTRVLTHPQGGLKNIPQGARKVALLNQADSPELRKTAAEMAKILLGPYDAVIQASLRPGSSALQDAPLMGSGQVYAVQEPVAGVILAAGDARRFGGPKQLLPWRGRPLVWHSASNALQAGLSPVIVVCGAVTQEIKSELKDLPVEIVHNPDWAQGQGTSVRVGVETLPPERGGAVFLLADQPQIPVQLIVALVERHAAGLAPIVAPRVAGQLTNPVLFDRDLFTALASLSGEVGGRKLFSSYPPVMVDWDEAAILLDVDTPEDYLRLKEIE